MTAVGAAHILLVEDDPATAELVEEVLGDSGASFEVTHARTLAEACAAVAETTPACVLLDLGLPDADGLEGFHEIERLAPTVPVVVLTGRDDETFAISAVQAGAQDYLRKRDITGDAMRRAVRHAIERKRSETELAHRALHDQLTGLPNRTLLMDRLKLALARLPRSGMGVTLLFGDLDGFKAINDTAGHPAGDKVLVAVADRLRRAVGAGGTVARFGGDEFAVVVEGSGAAAEIQALAAGFVAAVATPPISVSGLRVGMTIGTTWTADPRADPDDLVRAADASMYLLKGRSRDSGTPAGRQRRLPAPAAERAAYLRERREAEQRLFEAEERFRGAFEDAPIGMALVATEEGRLGRVLRVNHALARILRVPAEALLDTDLATVLDAKDGPALKTAAGQVIRGAEPAEEVLVRGRRGDGTSARLALSLSILREQPAPDPTVLVQIQDVTERLHAERGLRRSEAAKAAIVEAALDSVVTIDAGGRVLEFNSAAEATFGYSRGEVLGHDVADLLLPEWRRDRFRANVAAFRETGTTPMVNERIEMVAMRADGSEFPIEAAIVAPDGTPATLTGYIRDLSHERRSEVVAARLAAVVESSQDAIVSKDLYGTITSWNPAAERLYGYSAEEAIGRSVEMLVVDAAEWETMFARLTAGERIEPHETVRRRKDGSLVDIAVSISPVHGSAGQVVGVAAIARDITEKKRALRDLQRSEARYRALVSQLPDSAVYQYDSECRVVMAEGALIEQAAARSEDLVGRTIWELVPDQRAAPLVALLRAALRGRAGKLEWEATESGMILDLDVVPLRDAEGHITGAMVLARDVTERRGIERDLHFQAELLDRLDVAVIATDLDGQVTHWNRQAEASYQRPAHEALGRSIWALNVAYGLPDQREAMAQLERADGSSRGEVEVVRPDGTSLPLLLTGSPIRSSAGAVVGFAGVGVDITAQRRVAEELRGARELFESAFENAPMGMVLVGADGGSAGALLRVNHAMGRMLGRAREELLGRPFYDVIHHEDVVGFLPEVESLLAGVDSAFQTEVRFTGSHGRTVWGEVSVSLIRGADGSPLHAVALVNDVSGARHDEAAKAALEARLHQSQRLDGLGRLAGGVAHDFNNLLAVIINYADLVAEGLPHDAMRADVEQIMEAAERAAALTRQLLTFGRQEVVQPQALDLNAIVRDTEKLLRRTLGEHIELRAELAPDLPSVRADRSQLEQVLLNLAVNARDAMPAGGAITIGTTSVGHAGGGRRARLLVADTGCGMAPEVADRAFEPFFTTKPAGAGSGLGLATVYGIVTKGGGDIAMTTAAGEGTTFEIGLPVWEGVVAECAAESAQLSAGGSETVLLVEDEPAVRALAARLLTDSGYRVLTAGRPEDALALARDGAPDLLLTDVVMPGMSGTDLAGMLCRNRPELRVLYMSGYADDVVMRHGVRERRLSFLEKPFTRASLLAGVRASLNATVEAPHAAE